MMKRISIALALTVACLPAQWIKQPTPGIPRTADGKPNLAAPAPRMPVAVTPDTELIEAVCAENEKDRIHLVGKKSDDQKNAVQLAPEILAKYAGTYEFRASELGYPGPEVVRVKIAVENGVLLFGFGDAQKTAMTPLSENTFTNPSVAIEFGKNDKGEVTHMVMRLNRSEFRGERKRENK